MNGIKGLEEVQGKVLVRATVEEVAAPVRGRASVPVQVLVSVRVSARARFPRFPRYSRFPRSHLDPLPEVTLQALSHSPHYSHFPHSHLAPVPEVTPHPTGEVSPRTVSLESVQVTERERVQGSAREMDSVRATGLVTAREKALEMENYLHLRLPRPSFLRKLRRLLPLAHLRAP